MVWGRWFRFILLQAEIHLSQHHILKSPFFSQWIVLASFLKKIDVKYELFSEISGIFHCSVCLSSQRCCLDYSLCSKSWSENYASWNSVLFQQRFGYSGSHVCPCEFWTCQLPEKKKKSQLEFWRGSASQLGVGVFTVSSSHFCTWNAFAFIWSSSAISATFGPFQCIKSCTFVC